MEAVLFHDFDDAVVTEVPTPTPDDDEVLIEVSRVQLSVTECNLYRGKKIAHYDQIERRLEDGPARMLGHEFCGVIVETGDSIEEYETGDRVYAPGKLPCEECHYCESNHSNYCPNKTQIGYDIPGALAEYLTLPESPLCTLPDEVSDAEGAAMQPLASSVLCVESGKIGTGDVVATVGAGVMGYQCAQLAQLEGAKNVFGIDLHSEKLSVVKDAGIVPIDITEEDPVDVIEDRTDGVGADVVFEAVGGEQHHGTEGEDPLAQAVRLVRRGGSILQVGHIIGEIELTPRELRSKGVDWLTPTPGVRPLNPSIDSAQFAAELVAEGRVSISDFITHELDGLGSFEKLVDITRNKPEYDALGPAQIVV